jgi:uncharacterized protein (DUF433 family)
MADTTTATTATGKARDLTGIKARGTATVLNKPGAVTLDDYPLLCYAPAQWGPGVRVASNGVEVAAVADALAGGRPAEAVASQFGVTPEEAAEAGRYASAAQLAATAPAPAKAPAKT